MRAVQVGTGIENIDVTDVPDATPNAGEVLIATEAATINPVDRSLATGALAARIPAAATAPFTPGWDLVGTVVALGDGVDPVLLGARVIGFSVWFAAGVGTQAGLVALPVENIAVAPESLSSARLTTVGLNGLTAWRTLDVVGPIETLVVTGAVGGVGGYVSQLAALRGIRVTALVTSLDDAELAKSYGASDVVTSIDDVRGSDALIDTATVGGAIAAVRDGGRFITVTAAPEPEREIHVERAGARADAAALATLAELATAGALATPVEATFDVAQARAAYTLFATGKHRGRIVLTF